MITLTTKSPDLAIPFADVLNVDTIQDLKDGLGMMGMRFTGKPTKAHIVKTYDNSVKENPADVLRCLRPEELTLMDNILKRDFRKKTDDSPSTCFPYHTSSNGVFIIPINAVYASQLIPPFGINEDEDDMEPWKYAIKKTLVLREDNERMKKGSVLLFYQKTSDAMAQSLLAVGVV